MKRKEEVSIFKAVFKEQAISIEDAQLEKAIAEGLKRVRKEKFKRNLKRNIKGVRRYETRTGND